MKQKQNLKSWINSKFIKIRTTKIAKKLQSNMDKNSHVFFTVAKNITQENIIEETLTNAKRVHVDDKKQSNRKLWKLSFFLLNVILIVGVFYSFAKEQGGIQPLSTLLANNPKWSLLFIALGLFLLTNIFNALKFVILIYNKTKKFRPLFSYKTSAIGRYYDLITPMGSGGQPFEIYHLKKNGYSGDVATAIPLAKYMFWQFTFTLLCIIILVTYSHNVESTLVLVLAWIGLIAVVLLFLFVLFMSLTKKLGASIVVGILKLLHKMKIIKDYRKTLKKVLQFVKQYQFCMKSFAKSPLTILFSVLVSLGSIVCNSIIAYFVCSAFNPNLSVTIWDILCKCTICELAVCFVPLPGGSGATELSFNALVGSLFPVGTLFWGILIWRLLTYYLYIVQGAIIMIFDMIFHKKKLKSGDIAEIKLKDNNLI